MRVVVFLFFFNDVALPVLQITELANTSSSHRWQTGMGLVLHPLTVVVHKDLIIISVVFFSVMHSFDG